MRLMKFLMSKNICLKEWISSFERVEIFLSYLSKEEQGEREKFSLDIHAGPIGQQFIPDIFSQYQNEKEWIQESIRRKGIQKNRRYAGARQKGTGFRKTQF